MTGFDFSQPADVVWFTSVSPQDKPKAGQSRHFLQATDALRFVMEELHGVPHATASIALDKGSLTLDEIELLYSRLGRGQRYPE
ncbi:MAG: hypothetical protein ACREDW_06645 [Aestuariivirgaceae bacterium]